MVQTVELEDGRLAEIHPVELEVIRVRVLPDGRMTRQDAAKYIGRSEKTIAMWDLNDPNKLGSVKVGGRRFYYKDRLDAFIRGDAATTVEEATKSKPADEAEAKANANAASQSCPLVHSTAELAQQKSAAEVGQGKDPAPEAAPT